MTVDLFYFNHGLKNVNWKGLQLWKHKGGKKGLIQYMNCHNDDPPLLHVHA